MPTSSPHRRMRLQVCALAVIVFVPSLVAQGPTKRSARDIHVKIETDKHDYEVGDSIKLRLTLRNTSSHDVQFRAMTPRATVDLRVVDSDGRQLDADHKRLRQIASGNWFNEVQLKAGEERTLSWKGSEWLDVQDWGYKFVKPGRYVIVGVPALEGERLAHENSVRSNRVSITVNP